MPPILIILIVILILGALGIMGGAFSSVKQQGGATKKKMFGIMSLLLILFGILGLNNFIKPLL